LSCWSELKYYSDPEIGCIKYVLCSASVLGMLLCSSWPGCSFLDFARSSRLQCYCWLPLVGLLRWVMTDRPKLQRRHYIVLLLCAWSLFRISCIDCMSRSLITYNCFVLGVACVWTGLLNLARPSRVTLVTNRSHNLDALSLIY